MSSQPIVSAPATSESGIEESLTLPDGRTLAYSHSGPLDSDLIVIWFHGLFSVGDATDPPPPVKQRNAHFIMPTLPGWGNTSPLLPGTTYAETVVGDTLALLKHLHPTYDPTQLRIFVAGGSLGTVPAQIVFGAPYARFPYGRQLAGMLLLAPFSPFREHVGYAKGLRWREWISVGPPTRVVPGNVVPRLMKLAIAGKVRDVPSAEAFLHHEYFENMDEEERGRYAGWRERRGVEEGFFQRRMAEGMVRSIGELDEEHSSNPVVIGIGRGDTSLWGMSKFLSESYRRVRVREYEGGHLASAWGMDDVLEDMLGGIV